MNLYKIYPFMVARVVLRFASSPRGSKLFAASINSAILRVFFLLVLKIPPVSQVFDAIKLLFDLQSA